MKNLLANAFLTRKSSKTRAQYFRDNTSQDVIWMEHFSRSSATITAETAGAQRRKERKSQELALVSIMLKIWHEWNVSLMKMAALSLIQEKELFACEIQTRNRGRELSVFSIEENGALFAEIKSIQNSQTSSAVSSDSTALVPSLLYVKRHK